MSVKLYLRYNLKLTVIFFFSLCASYGPAVSHIIQMMVVCSSLNNKFPFDKRAGLLRKRLSIGKKEQNLTNKKESTKYYTTKCIRTFHVRNAVNPCCGRPWITQGEHVTQFFVFRFFFSFFIA